VAIAAYILSASVACAAPADSSADTSLDANVVLNADVRARLDMPRDEVRSLVREELESSLLTPIQWVIPLASLLVAVLAVILGGFGLLTWRRNERILEENVTIKELVDEVREVERFVVRSQRIAGISGWEEIVGGKILAVATAFREKAGVGFEEVADALEALVEEYDAFEKTKLALQAQVSDDFGLIKEALMVIRGCLAPAKAIRILEGLRGLYNPFLTDEERKQRDELIEKALEELEREKTCAAD